MNDRYERLDAALQRYANDEAACVLGVSELDGFFHAVACGPEPVPSAVWLPALWGGEEYVPAWRDEQEAQAFRADVLAHHATVEKALARGECSPLFLEGEENGRLQVIPDAWCEGFLLGMLLWGDAADTVPEELLEPILFFAVDLDDPDAHEQMRAATPAEEVELLQELIPQSVFGMREFFGIGRPPGNPKSRRFRSTTAN